LGPTIELEFGSGIWERRLRTHRINSRGSVEPISIK
jgi:hypothetical protein